MESDDPLVEQNAKEHLVFLVHGIRTLMSWRRVLRKELNDSISDVDTITFYYGFFSLLRFYLPFTRERIVRQFVLEYFEQVATRRPTRVSIIAHSFGTYVVCRALQKYPLVVDTLILCGSVVPERDKFNQWFLHGKERVQVVVNDIAQKDVCVLLGKLMIPGVGAGGLVGLSGIPGTRLIERVFSGYTHGSFFTSEHYKKYWIPVLNGKQPQPVDSNLEIPALYQTLLAWSTSIKLLGNILVVALLIWGGLVGWSFGTSAYTAWSARPFQVVGPAAIEKRPQSCSNTGAALTRAAKITLVAPPATSGGKLQIRVVVDLATRSRWTIDDVSVFGDGRVQMNTPNRDYWLYDISPAQQMDILICAVTNEPTGGALVDDLKIQFSNASWL